MFEPKFIPTSFILELIHPPLNHPDRVLKEVFVEVSDPHRYSTFQLIGGRPGAVFSSGEKRRCEITPDRLIIREDRSELSFRDLGQDSMNLIESIRKRIPIQVFLTTCVTVQSLVPLPPGQADSARLMLDLCWKAPEEAFMGFNRPLGGVGFRLVFPPTREDMSEIQMRLEPSFADRRMIFLEIQHRFLHPYQTREELEAAYDRTLDFQSRQVVEFLNRIGEGTL